MKKFLLVVIGVLSLNAAAFSQMGFGVKAGYNYGNIRTDSSVYYEIKGKSSFHLGIFLLFPVKDKISVQTDIMFSGGGGTTRKLGEARFDGQTAVQGYHQDKYTINYISIPIVARYAFGPANVQLGPQLGILSRALIDDSYVEKKTNIDPDNDFKVSTSESSSLEKRKDVQDYFKKMDFGLAAGVGCEFDRFQGSIRYYMGLLNISNYGDAVKNSSIQVSVGWRLSEDY